MSKDKFPAPSNPTGIKIVYLQTEKPGRPYEPVPINLEPDTSVLLLCKDRRSHGPFFMIIEQNGRKRFLYGQHDKPLLEIDYNPIPGVHKDSLIFNLPAGQFIYFPDDVFSKTSFKGNNHCLHFFIPELKKAPT